MLDFITDLLGKWIDPLYYMAYWSAGLIGVLASNKMMNKNRIFLKRPTLLGWSFIFCIILAFLLSFVKENKQDREASNFRSRLTNSENERKKADSLYASKLESVDSRMTDINTGLIRRDTVWLKQLDKWGLSIKDSMIVKKEGSILVRPAAEMVIIDSNKSGNNIHFVLCNDGDRQAKNVEIKVAIVFKNELDTAYRFAVYHNTFAPGECWKSYNKWNYINSKEIYFVFKMTYVESNNKTVEDFYTVGYIEDTKSWGFSSARLGHLFKHLQ